MATPEFFHDRPERVMTMSGNVVLTIAKELVAKTGDPDWPQIREELKEQGYVFEEEP
jgi:hypothetical protein